MVVLDGKFALRCGPGTDYPYTHTHTHTHTHTNTQYIPGQHDRSINTQTVCTGNTD